MTKREVAKLFEDRKIRTVWDDKEEKWYFSIVDVVGVLTDQPDVEHARNYWKVLKHRLNKEGNETVTNCNQLKMLANDGKMRLTDVADQQQLFRIIQSIPSPKAEPFKQWMAQVATTVELSKSQNPKGFRQSAKVAHEGGKIAGETRAKIESQTGRSIVSKEKATDYLPPADRWESLPEEDKDE